MDIDAAVAELIALAAALIADTDKPVCSPNHAVLAESGYELAEKCLQIDEWITRDGHMPVRWNSIKGKI